jgi:excisionase family DNA binding protein
MTLTESPAVLTVTETATLLRISPNTCYAAIQRGELPARRVGRRLLIPRDALELFLSAAAKVPESPAAHVFET